METHRKRVRHFHEPGDFHELTFSCYQRLPLLTTAERCRLLCQAIDRAISSHEFSLAAFVIMPEHVHLLVYPHLRGEDALATDSRRQWHPNPADNPMAAIVAELSRLLADIKRPFSGRVKKRMLEEGDPLIERLMVLERPGKRVFRFWQEGPGYDRNLSSDTNMLTAVDYIHLNPVRRGLVARAVDWKWSSARWYVSDGKDLDPDLPTIHGSPTGLFD